MSLLLHISDTHFGTEQPAVVEALVQIARELRPELLVLSGDITQRARRWQFRAAREFVARLAVPARLVIAGNHDIPLFNLPARVFAPYANHRRAFGHDLEPAFENEALLVIGVRTTRRYRHIDGEISHAQIGRVTERLRSATERRLRIVVTHHPVHVTRPTEVHNLLHGREAALRAWADAGADLVIGGHIHLPYVRPASEGLAGLAREVWVAQAGTAVSTRIRRDAPNSVNVIRYEPSGGARRCAVEHWDYDAAAGRFAIAARHDLILDRLFSGT